MSLDITKISPVHPASLMILFWILIGSVYYLGPIYLTPQVTLSTFTFLMLHILFFILGSTLFIRLTLYKPQDLTKNCISYIHQSQIDQIIFIILIIGVSGGLINILCKLSAVDLLNFASIAQLRSVRAQVLLSGQNIQSGFMSALSFLTYPAGFVGVVASLIDYERIPRVCKKLSYLFVFVIVFLAVCMGGRSPIMVLFLFIGTSFYVRGKLGKSYIPKSVPLRLAVILLLLLFIAYSSFIWVARTKESGMSTGVMLQHAENVWGAHPKDSLIAVSNWLGDPNFTQTVLSSTFYFIQNLSISERILSSSSEIPTMYGAYQVDLFAAFCRIIPGGGEFLKNGYGLLLDANVYGFFTGAWTGLFIDFGSFSLLMALLWGAIAGKSWLSFKRDPNLLTGTIYVFWTYSVFISFVSSPFGFSNSFMIFCWFAFFSLASTFLTRYKLLSI